MTDYIRICFEIDKYCILVLERGKELLYEHTVLKEAVNMIKLDAEGHKYYGIVPYKKSKEITEREYFKKLGEALQPKLNGAKIIKAFNIWAVTTIEKWSRNYTLNY